MISTEEGIKHIVNKLYRPPSTRFGGAMVNSIADDAYPTFVIDNDNMLAALEKL